VFLSYALSGISFRANENLTKAERLADKLSQILHDGLLGITVGRMDQTKKPVDHEIISISTSTGISWNFVGTTLSGVFAPPYYDNDTSYQIESISWSGGTTPGSGSSIMIDIQRDQITFSGTTDTTNTLLTVQMRYLDRRKKVIFDRRTGRIEINKN
jgi:hypothetical protein